jgi:hypothetical protein
MNSKKSFYTVAEALSFIEELKARTERMPDLLGFKSQDIGKGFKTLIQMSNSLAIVLMQYDLNDMALILLKHSSDADSQLHRFGSAHDKLWEGSLLTFNNLILLFHRVKHYKESLKLVYQAQSFILLLKKNKAKLAVELEISTHMLSFISLWKVKRTNECVSYLQSATDLLNLIIESRTQSRLSQSVLDNLFGLIASSLAALKMIVEKNKNEALQILNKALKEVDGEAGCRTVLETVFGLISNNSELEAPNEDDLDWLCGNLYQQLIIITCFVPLIDPRTPIIPAEELEAIANQGLEEKEKPEKKEGVYYERKAKIIPKQKKHKEEGKKVKHWWENKQFVSEFGNRAEKHESFVSEPRRAKRSNRISRSIEVTKGVLFSPSSRKLPSKLEGYPKLAFEGISRTQKGLKPELYDRSFLFV